MICNCDHEIGEICSMCMLQDPVLKEHYESGAHARNVAMMQQWATEMGIELGVA